MLPALPLVVLVPAHSRAAVWAGQGRPEPAAEKSVSYWEHSWNWSSCSSLPLSLTYFWRDWAVEEEWIFCLRFQSALGFPKDRFWQTVAWRRCISHAVWVWWCLKKRGQKKVKLPQRFDWKLPTWREQQLSSWAVPLSADQLNSSQSFILPFSVIHLTPTMAA